LASNRVSIRAFSDVELTAMLIGFLMASKLP